PLGDREQLEQDEGILGRGLADPSERTYQRHDGDDQNEDLEHAHAYARHVIGELLEEDRSEPLPGRSFTPHRGLLPACSPASGRSAYRSPPGSERRPTAGAARRWRRPPRGRFRRERRDPS